MQAVMAPEQLLPDREHERQSIVSIRRRLNCEGVASFQNLTDTWLGALEIDARLLRRIDTISVLLMTGTGVRTLEELASESMEGTREWIDRTIGKVSARRLAIICGLCEEDIEVEQLLPYRARLRIAIAATIVDDLAGESTQRETGQQLRGSHSQRLAQASTHWEAFLRDRLKARHVGYREEAEWQELFLLYKSYYPDHSRVMGQLLE